MTRKVPTQKQFDQLRCLVGVIVVAAGFKEWQAIVARGWVTAAWGRSLDDVKTVGRSKFWPPLKLSPDGYRALADGIEAYGWPDPEPKKEGTR